MAAGGHRRHAGLLCFHAKLPAKLAFIPYPWAASQIFCSCLRLRGYTRVIPCGYLDKDYIHVDDLAEGHICALQKAYPLLYFFGLC